eukprot:SAG22_NODE_18898_length_280_cov_0.845304_1_plen_61_part_10
MGRVPVEHAGVRVWTDQGVQVYSPGPECQGACQLLRQDPVQGGWVEFEPPAPGWAADADPY